MLAPRVPRAAIRFVFAEVIDIVVPKDSMNTVILADAEQPLAGALHLLDGVVEVIEIVTEQPNMFRKFKFDDPICPSPFQVDVGKIRCFPFSAPWDRGGLNKRSAQERFQANQPATPQSSLLVP